MAIVAAVLAANEVFPSRELAKTVLLGELGLDGRVRPVRGILPATLAAAQCGFIRAIVPLRQAGEAQLVDGIDVLGVASLSQLVALLNDKPIPVVEPIETAAARAPAVSGGKDLADVVGQLEAKWALEVAAAGRHHLYLHGPPGVGKTMLAERLPSLLPDLELTEALEVSAVHSLAGFDLWEGLVLRPPYADPHHSASMATIVGGGREWPSPEQSRAPTVECCSSTRRRYIKHTTAAVGVGSSSQTAVEALWDRERAVSPGGPGLIGPRTPIAVHTWLRRPDHPTLLNGCRRG